jgi:hypothetical protein
MMSDALGSARLSATASGAGLAGCALSILVFDFACVMT